MKNYEQIAQWIAKNYPDAGKVVEVGVGKFPDISKSLKGKIPNCKIICTDVRKTEISNDIEFYRDDITSPNKSIYENADLIFSIRTPPELYPSLESLSDEIKADLLIKPLSSEESPRIGKLLNYHGMPFYIKKSGKE